MSQNKKFSLKEKNQILKEIIQRKNFYLEEMTTEKESEQADRLLNDN